MLSNTGSASCLVPPNSFESTGSKYIESVQAAYSGDGNYSTAETTFNQKVT
jgi:hypothetical protein